MGKKFDGIGVQNMKRTPIVPTPYRPGSEEKIREMMKRVEKGETPFHKEDWIPIIRVRPNGEEIEGIKPE